mmetsp:Transcript_88562/g.286033  ORF Transcript_88562/g.286033 Transcript_88562/m.286033 type:complete len:252 (+) Transcript_88562:606-1361(+)
MHQEGLTGAGDVRAQGSGRVEVLLVDKGVLAPVHEEGHEVGMPIVSLQESVHPYVVLGRRHHQARQAQHRRDFERLLEHDLDIVDLAVYTGEAHLREHLHGLHPHLTQQDRAVLAPLQLVVVDQRRRAQLKTPQQPHRGLMQGALGPQHAHKGVGEHRSAIRAARELREDGSRPDLRSQGACRDPGDQQRLELRKLAQHPIDGGLGVVVAPLRQPEQPEHTPRLCGVSSVHIPTAIRHDDLRVVPIRICSV